MTAVLNKPETLDQWNTYLEDTCGTPEAFAKAFSDGSFKDAVNHYVTAKNKERTDIADQVREQVQLALAEMYNQDGAGDRPPVDIGNSSGRARSKTTARDLAVRNPRAAGVPYDGICDSVGGFMQDVWHQTGRMDAAAKERRAKLQAYQEQVPAEGGFVVPEEFRSDLMINALEDAIVRPRAQVVPMSSLTLRYPKIDETSRVSTVYGGLVAYRTEEAAELVESNAKFSALKLECTKQTMLANVTNELIADWAAFESFINSTYPPAMAYFEDLDWINGTGAGEPLGGLASANGSLIVAAAEGGQSTGTIVWLNVLRMYARMLPSSIPTSVWMASPDTFVELATMALNVGTGGSAVWLVDAHGAPVLTLLGRPVVMTEKAPGKLGQQSDLSFVDWGMYLIGDRQQVTVASSAHVKFTSDQTTYRMIARNDGRPWTDKPITPHNNGDTLSPFITLAARP
jgi:HK97 family phage major capsid protein